MSFVPFMFLGAQNVIFVCNGDWSAYEVRDIVGDCGLLCLAEMPHVSYSFVYRILSVWVSKVWYGLPGWFLCCTLCMVALGDDCMHMLNPLYSFFVTKR
jgi:hypothetical protein